MRSEGKTLRVMFGRGKARAPSAFMTVVRALGVGALAFGAGAAIGAQPLIPLSPNFDYSRVCIAPAAIPAPRNWARWDGKSATGVSPDDMLRDAQTLYNPFTPYQRSPAIAARLALYLSQQPFAGAGRALHLYARILADGDAASTRADEILRTETEAIKRGTAEAGTFLGRLYRDGGIVPVDLKAAQSYLTGAANAGDLNAELELARLYSRNPQLADAPDAAQVYAGRAIAKMSEKLGAGDCSVLTGFADIMIDADLGFNDPKASVEWLRAAAKLGDLRAISTIAKRYLQGNGVAQSQPEAIELLKQAAALGHSGSRLTLADLLLAASPPGSGKNEAFRLLSLETERNNPRAYEMRAAYYRGSYGTKPAPDLELQNLQKAAALPGVSLRSLELLGIAYARGTAGAPNVELAKQTLMQAADLGSARAAFELYNLSSGEKPLIRLERSPLDYLQEAAENGLGGAMSELSSLYACGDGVEKDAAKSAEWLQKAAAAGNVRSLMILADAAYAADTSEQHATGFALLKSAADQGDAEAMMRVSLSYRLGLGTEKNLAAGEVWGKRAMKTDAAIAALTEARSLLSPAASQERDSVTARSILGASASTGNPDLLFELGKLYADRDPTLESDPEKAVSLFVESASKGNVSAMLRLVDMRVVAVNGGGSDWRQWLARAKATDDLRATLKEAEIEPDADRRAVILATAIARPLCLGKERLQVAMALRDLPQFRQNYLSLFDQVIAEPTTDPGTKYQVSRFLLAERPGEQAKAVDMMKSAAEGGKREAMREIGRMYSAGKLLPEDKEKAYLWLVRGAKLGDEGALESLVTSILSEQSTLDDPASGDRKVEALLHDLVAEDSPPVAMLLSRLYLRLSDSSPAFLEPAKSWTLKAASLGNAQAMLNASDFYAAGTHGFEQSNAKSTEWLAKAARAGYRGAFEKYAIALQIGFGTQPDVDEAQRWLSKSAGLAN